MIQITKIQLFMLVMLFEVGSTTLFALGIGAKQDAWLVVLLAFLISTGLIWAYTQFPRICPEQDFSEILNEAVGRKLAIPLLFIYGAYFFDSASYNFFEFGSLIKMSALPMTPILVILYFFMLVSIYILSLGFEVLARTGEILLPVFIIFMITIFVFTMFSGQFDINEILPILGNGIKPLLGKTLFDVVFFPFGELVVFIMFWHFVNKQEGIRKITFIAVALSTFLIIFSLIIMLSILGPDLTANTEIPLLQTILSINIANFFTNLDLLAVLIMFIGGFYKMSLHFYGVVLAIIWIFKIKNIRWVILAIGLMFPIWNNLRFENMAYHRWLGFEVHPYVMAMVNLMTILLLIVIFLKKKVMILKKRRKSDANSTSNQES
ncbi:GerAB/ArcD/ProY family transporter [Neobacillus cucumis]|uniref:GerAB/ArcD/ProY family transporter n=1 Tax=Neobacillus cucumis TaxID=1740721 RepID=UPI001964AAC8|nr:GerAB/ArcD/ProY family transporter [Neobacillus cucumis]MBM7654944.1 spore germination protein KB [Neobacillus cucumis]